MSKIGRYPHACISPARRHDSGWFCFPILGKNITPFCANMTWTFCRSAARPRSVSMSEVPFGFVEYQDLLGGLGQFGLVWRMLWVGGWVLQCFISRSDIHAILNLFSTVHPFPDSCEDRRSVGTCTGFRATVAAMGAMRRGPVGSCPRHFSVVLKDYLVDLVALTWHGSCTSVQTMLRSNVCSNW